MAALGKNDDVALIADDDSGSDTFARYRWQAKQAVLAWLGCLGSEAGALGVLCEGLEDIVVVRVEGRVFAQLKTRTRGSWSTAKVRADGGGLDSLIRAHNLLETHLSTDTFELWLEGPAGEARETLDFFTAPLTATVATRKQLQKHGLKSSEIESFLSKVRIRPDRAPRSSIDAVVAKYIGALWPGLSTPEQDALYGVLLRCAEQAQSGELVPYSNCTDLLNRAGVPADEATRKAMETRCLTREHIQGLTPPLPDSSRDELLARIEKGDYASALELKMLAGGVKAKTILAAQQLRADAERRRFELLGASEDNVAKISEIEENLREIADAQVANADLLGGSNPSIGARPGEFVVSQLRSNPANLLATDELRMFGGATLLYGLLCQVSDECKIWWRAQ